jgi:hypothetical protein
MQKVAVLFSGGSDSTLAAAMAAEAGHEVHLLTFDRISFIGAQDYTQFNLNNLRRIYGKRIHTHQVINIDQLHATVCYANYFEILFQFGLTVTSLCFTKIAMHWATAIYCKEHQITNVVDGSTPYMHMYPDQNHVIAHGNLKDFYKTLGINYETPIFSISDSVEQKLYDRGITTQPQVRGTDKDLQVFYLEQVLLALFLKFYLTVNSIEKYEAVLAKLYKNRLKFILNRDFSNAT